MTRIERIGDCTVKISNDVVVTQIYAVSGDDGVVQYVGSTIHSIKRLMAKHISEARDGSELPFHAWLRDQSTVTVDVKEVAYGRSAALEQKWVRKLKPLLNLTDGGPGMSGHRFAGTEHAKRIQSAVRSGAHFDCHRCGAKFWRKRVEIQKGHNKFCSRICSNARHKEVAHVA